MSVLNILNQPSGHHDHKHDGNCCGGGVMPPGVSSSGPSPNDLLATNEQKLRFPLKHLFDLLTIKNGWDKGFKSVSKQFMIMSTNLSPALAVNEGIELFGASFGGSHILDFIKPVAAIFTRQGLVDGINNENRHKVIASSVSAVALIGAKKFLGLSRALIRPVLAVFLYGIEELKSLKHILGIEKIKHECSHHDHGEEGHVHKDPTVGGFMTGLGLVELQLNTVAPLVSSISDKVVGADPEGIFGGIKKVVFNTVALSTGFVGLGEAIKQGAKMLGKHSQAEAIQKFIANIESVICPCCGAAGACANAVSEDIIATSV